MKKEVAKQILKQTRENYNLIAQEFSSKRQILWQDLNPLLQYITGGDKVLDLGCGNGRLFEAVKGRGVDYLGVDNSEKLIKIAKAKYPEGRFQIADGLNLPFAHNSFDKIFCIAVFHHIPGREFRRQFLEQAKRVLKPGGLLILTAWKMRQKKGLKLVLKYRLLKLIGKSRMDWADVLVPWADKCRRYVHQFTARSMRKELKKTGFEILKIGTLWRSERKDKNLFAIAKKV